LFYRNLLYLPSSKTECSGATGTATVIWGGIISTSAIIGLNVAIDRIFNQSDIPGIEEIGGPTFHIWESGVEVTPALDIVDWKYFNDIDHWYI